MRPSLPSAWLLTATLLACDAPAREPDRGAASGAAALVNGEPISLREVEQVAAAAAISPHEALRRLVAERLLAQRASARAYGEAPAVRQAVEQAAVQALLAREIETGASGAQETGAGDGGATLVDARRDRLERLLRELRAQTEVRYREPAIRRALAAPQR